MSERKLRVFLCHASQDKPVVRELYQRLLAERWIDPWLDEEKLLPGQDWDVEIEKAVEVADAVIVCLSNNSITKEGYIQRELKFALDVALEKPEETIFIIPLRLNDCQPPRKLRSWQHVDYFPNNRRKMAYERIMNSLKTRSLQRGIVTVKSSKPTGSSKDVVKELQASEASREKTEIQNTDAESRESSDDFPGEVDAETGGSVIGNPSSWPIYSSISSIVISAISFLADIIALAQISYHVIVDKNIDNLALQLSTVGLVFLLGLGLGIVGLRGLNRLILGAVAIIVLRTYIWGYLILACISYVGTVITFRQPYTFSSYIANFLVIGIELAAFALLRGSLRVRPTRAYALTLMSVSVLHALIFLYSFIFINLPDYIYVLGEWAFWFAWTLFSFPLLRSAFLSTDRSSSFFRKK